MQLSKKFSVIALLHIILAAGFSACGDDEDLQINLIVDAGNSDDGGVIIVDAGNSDDVGVTPGDSGTLINDSSVIVDGGGDIGVDSVVVTITSTTPKKLIFGWQDVPNATSYRLLESIDGKDRYQWRGMPVPPGSQKIELEVPLLARTEAHWRVASCIGQDCTLSATVGADRVTLNNAIQRYESPSSQADAKFGTQVSLSGNGQVLAVGAPGQNDAGSVYIYQKTNGQWMFAQELLPSNLQAEDQFGSALSLSDTGHTLVVSARGKNQEAGAAYIFEYDGREWSEESYLTAPNPQAEARFGFFVVLNPIASVLAIGAPDESIDGTNNTGAAYIFTKDGNTWRHRNTISAPQDTESGRFGMSIALSFGGNRIAISAPAMNHPGIVYLYERFVNDWNLQQELQASNALLNDGFGQSISFNGEGTLLAVGAPRRNGLSGHVYIFDYRSSDWQEIVRIPADVLDLYLGGTVLLNRAGTRLIVAAPFESYVEGGINGELAASRIPNSGAIYFFVKQADGSWEGKSSAKSIRPKEDAFFSTSVAIDSRAETVVVGAPFENLSANTENEGAIYLY